MNFDQKIQSLKFKGNSLVKAAVLLTISFFMISAPAPDSGVVAEMTSDLIIVANSAVFEEDFNYHTD